MGVFCDECDVDVHRRLDSVLPLVAVGQWGPLLCCLVQISKRKEKRVCCLYLSEAYPDGGSKLAGYSLTLLRHVRGVG